jgi:hypothetical protein
LTAARSAKYPWPTAGSWSPNKTPPMAPTGRTAAAGWPPTRPAPPPPQPLRPAPRLPLPKRQRPAPARRFPLHPLPALQRPARKPGFSNNCRPRSGNNQAT